MRRAALLPLLLAGCGLLDGRWERIAEVEGTVVSIDRENVRAQGEGVYRLWERAETPGSDRVLYTLVDYDCGGGRLRLVQFFDEPREELEVGAIPPLGVWHTAAPGSQGGEKLEKGCALVRSLQEERGG